MWLATGHTDMLRGFIRTLVISMFLGAAAATLIKIIWHDGQGACLFMKRLERGRFLWPSLADGVVTISVAQLSTGLSNGRSRLLPALAGFNATYAKLFAKERVAVDSTASAVRWMVSPRAPLSLPTLASSLTRPLARAYPTYSPT
ncbi:IS66 family insertion sequence element accessory protein TnpB [Bradyrhizobium sp. WSM471]|uniref:IS66 family insertion sequence element accessory protein TnpB n=1 Tax=Bradyrhizobium sp. WSM471 TaxID=319017 RepID=UPI000A02455D|nr:MULTISPECIES: IS66 family insertion sequence element accessory protein TnpB [Bradyrhizobium]UFW43087.1 IS66 family insertion sequence element accessory protein TnpB [Bradyrhizobium canariense]